MVGSAWFVGWVWLVRWGVSDRVGVECQTGPVWLGLSMRKLGLVLIRVLKTKLA